MRARIGHRVERALDHRQQRDLGRHAALLDLLDDVVEVQPAAVEDALQVVRPRDVVGHLVLHQLGCRCPAWRSRAGCAPTGRRAAPCGRPWRRRAAASVDRLALAVERPAAWRRRGCRCRRAPGRAAAGAACLRRGAGVWGAAVASGASGAGGGETASSARAGGEQADQDRWQEPVQDLFFQSRIAANTLTGSETREPRYLLTDSTTAGSRQRRKGLVAFSSPSVLGSVGRPASLRLAVALLALAQRRVAGLDRFGEADVGERVFVPAVDLGLVGQARELLRATRTSARRCPRTGARSRRRTACRHRKATLPHNRQCARACARGCRAPKIRRRARRCSPCRLRRPAA